jgi:hypothetical protein
MTYESRVLALTRHIAKLSISPESSDGFASVGTILPKEEATSLPGGLFAFPEGVFEAIFYGWDGYQRGRETDEHSMCSGCCLKAESVVADAESREQKALPRKRRLCLRICVWCFK